MQLNLTSNIRPGEAPLDLAGYERAGGYEAVRKVVGKIRHEDVTQIPPAPTGSQSARTFRFQPVAQIEIGSLQRRRESK